MPCPHVHRLSDPLSGRPRACSSASVEREMRPPALEHSPGAPPLFSICIPQYNRTSFLLVLLRSIHEQTCRETEICVSDGGSDDGREPEILRALAETRLPFSYAHSETRLPYDANLRSSIGLARGQYCLLFGNDDALATPDSLARLAIILKEWRLPEVAIVNYLELGSGTIMRRVNRTAIMGSGPEVALAHFRTLSFVSGILLKRDLAQISATEMWDGSEMYQMYLGSRILAAGGRLLGIDEVLVHKDVQVEGEQVDSYARKPWRDDTGVHEIRLPLCQYARVAFDALLPYLDSEQRSHFAWRILKQVLVFTYPPWLVEYRRVRTWRFAAGVALGMRPRNLLLASELSGRARWHARAVYLAMTLAGLFVPHRLFRTLRPWLYELAKRTRWGSSGQSQAHGS